MSDLKKFVTIKAAEKGLSLRQVAIQADLSYPTLMNLNKKKLSMLSAMKLSKVLDIDPELLMK